MERSYSVASLVERPDLRGPFDAICSAGFPEFMFHDQIEMTLWGTMLRNFASFQLMLLEGDSILAIANSVPLKHEGAFDRLPDRGVGWGIEKSILDHGQDLAPNLLMAVQIVISKKHLRQGWSSFATAEIIALAARRGIENVVVPVRPTQKHLYPLIPMEHYIGWQNDDGLPYDGWLRVHVRAGGEIIRVCPESMYVRGTIAEWSQWTGLAFPGSGLYVVPGALVPVEIDAERDEGLYREPNVWVVHKSPPV